MKKSSRIDEALHAGGKNTCSLHMLPEIWDRFLRPVIPEPVLHQPFHWLTSSQSSAKFGKFTNYDTVTHQQSPMRFTLTFGVKTGLNYWLLLIVPLVLLLITLLSGLIAVSM